MPQSADRAAGPPAAKDLATSRILPSSNHTHFTPGSKWPTESVCPVVFELLEPRLLLSGNGILEADNIINMEWRDEIAQVVVDEWIVRFIGDDAKTDQLADSLSQYGFEGATVRGLGGNGFGLIELAGSDYESLSTWAQQEAEVLYVEPNFVQIMGEVIESTTPNDGSFSSLWGLNNTGQTGGTADADIDATEAWDLTTGSSDVVIGIIDTGIDYNHPDLVANMWTNPGEVADDGIDNDGNGFIDDVYGWDFANDDSDPIDGHSHGTHVSGTIGGVGNNSTGVAGVNWNVKLMALKFLTDSGWGYISNAISAVNYATMMKRDYGVNVLATSNSWGGGGFSSAMEDAIRAAGEEEILFVAAAGNSNSDNDVSPHYPSNYDLDNVISVAATDHNDNRASFSSYGATTVDLGAPGVSIYSTTRNGGYASYSGTSMATPHVSGVVGLMAAYNPSATIAEIKAAIFDSVDPIAALSGLTVTGGRLNAYEALQLIGGGEDTRGPTVASVSPSGQVAPTSQLSIVFNEDLLAESVAAGSFGLRGRGADGSFDTGDDTIITITSGMISQSQADRVAIDLGSDLVADTYRLTIRGTGANAIQDEAGNPLNDGSNTTASFEIINVDAGTEPDDVLAQANDSGLTAVGSATFSGGIGNGVAGNKDVDMYAVRPGEAMVVRADIDAAVSGSNLNSVLRLFDADGNELTFNMDVGSGTDSYIEFSLAAGGTYYIGVSGFGNISYDPSVAGSGSVGSVGNYLLTLSLVAADDSGSSVGPDGFGYTGRVVAFGFEDISSFGNTGLTSGDDRYFTISTSSLSGFNFEFYGRDQGDFHVSSNGLITFSRGYTAWYNSNLTSSPVYATIAPFWDDLVVDSSARVYWALRGAGDQQRLIVQWDDVRFYGHSGSGRVTFQSVLYEADNSIRFNYLDLDAGSHHSNGAWASVGIKDTGYQSVGQDVLQVSINSGSSDFVGTGMSTTIESARPLRSAFITQIYEQLLARSPDADELNEWLDGLGDGQFVVADVILGVLFGQEYVDLNTSNGDFVDACYQGLLGREADAGGRAAWLSLLDRNTLRLDVVRAFLDSGEFAAVAENYSLPTDSQGTNDAFQGYYCSEFVSRLYVNVLGRDADPGGLEAWKSALVDGYQTGAGVAMGFVFSQEYLNKNAIDGDFIDTCYQGLFGRDADPAGRAAWLSFLAMGASRFDVFTGFLDSQEFSNMADRYGIIPSKLQADQVLGHDQYRQISHGVYAGYLGSQTDNTVLNSWATGLSTEDRTVKDLAIDVISGQEYLGLNTIDGQFVDSGYLASFDRTSDAEGQDYFLSPLLNNASSMTGLCGFLDMTEFVSLADPFETLT